MTKIKNGYRSEKNGWICITVKGNAYDRGYANGYLVAPELKEVFKMLDFTLYHRHGLTREFFSDVISTLYRTQIEEGYPEYFEEMKGITDGANANKANVSFDDIVMYNCYYTLPYTISSLSELINDNKDLKKKYGNMFPEGETLKLGASEGGASDKCTGFIAVGDYTKDGKIVCGHNTFDNFIDAQYCNFITEIRPNKGNSIIMQSPPGCIASGTDFFVNSNGMICTETTIGGFSKFRLLDPICCRIRKVMQYEKGLDDCVKYLTHNNGGDYANSWLFGDTKTNTIMRVELGLDYVNVEKKKNGYFIGYNAPLDPRIRNLECANTGYSDIRRHQGARQVRLPQLMEQHKGKIDVKIGQDILADHFDVYLNKINPCSRTCCSHYELDERAFLCQPGRPVPYEPKGAIDGMVTDTTLAKKMGLSARWGSSCGMPFNSAEFFNKRPQWNEQKLYVKDRPYQPWTFFVSKRRDKTRKKIKK